jgi:hypothetical protein
VWRSITGFYGSPPPHVPRVSRSLVQACHSCLQFAGPSCKQDHDIVLKAVGVCPCALQYADLSLRADLTFMLRASTRWHPLGRQVTPGIGGPRRHWYCLAFADPSCQAEIFKSLEDAWDAENRTAWYRKIDRAKRQLFGTGFER